MWKFQVGMLEVCRGRGICSQSEIAPSNYLLLQLPQEDRISS